MNNTPITIIASSIENLKTQIEQFKSTTDRNYNYIHLMLYGEKSLVYLFDVKNVSSKELKNYVATEAKKMLSLIEENAAVDSQVFHTEAGTVQGVLIGMPEDHLKEYIQVLDESRLIPLLVTPYFCASVNSFKHHMKDKMGESCCFFDVSRPQFIHFIFFNKQKCEILRQVHYDQSEEAQKEVIQSLLSAIGKSSVKKLDQIFWFGKLDNNDEVIAQVQKQFEATVSEVPGLDIQDGIVLKENYFNLNFVKQFSLNLELRQKFLKPLNYVLIVSMVLLIAFSARLLQVRLDVKKVKSSYSPQDYDYAKKLESRLK